MHDRSTARTSPTVLALGALGLSILAGGCASNRLADVDAASEQTPRGAPVAAAAAGSTQPTTTTSGGADLSTQVARSALRERALDVLTQGAVSSEPLIRANAIEGLHPAPARAENVVRAGLADENAGVRFVSAYTVGKLKLRKSASFVDPLLSDPDPRVRAAAIFALTQCGQKPDPTPLSDMLEAEDALVRAEAARVLGDLGNRSAVPMLKASAAQVDSRNRARSGGLTDERLIQSERVFQLQVAESLVKLGEPEAIHAIRAALYPAGREGFESAAFAAQILGSLRWEKSAGELVRLIEDRSTPEQLAAGSDSAYLQPKEVRLAAAGALARMGYPDGMYVAEAFATDPDPTVRALSAYVFGLGGRRQDLPKLDQLMNDASPMVRISAAAGALRSIQGAER